MLLPQRKRFTFSSGQFSGFILAMNRLLQSLLFAVPLILTGCGALTGIEKPKFTISFHTQGTDMDSPRSIFRQVIPGHQSATVFKLVPEITQHNIAAFKSFPAPSGNENGVMLRLDFRGSNALDLVTRTRTGETMLTMVNGHAVDYVTIDKPVSDGVITIWEGIPDSIIAEMTKKYPSIDRLRSVSNGQEMLPTTRAEKRRSVKAANQTIKDEEKKAREEQKKGSDAGAPELPKTEAPLEPGNGLPRSPTTKKIPIEGGILNTAPEQLIKR
jgi:hypothetical protein